MKSVDHFSWASESSMEIRFMPSLAKNANQIGFILNLDDENARLLRKNSVFKENFNKDYVLEFVNDKTKDRFKVKGDR